jgi:radical SAM superfamily enzyme YgiQ (UPF0313 family)
MSTEISGKNALLLSGPQHWDDRRPTTYRLREALEYTDPLGIAIVSTFLKKSGFETYWAGMTPGKIDKLSTLIEQAGAVFISSRFFDSSLANQVVDKANRLGKPTIVGGYSPTFSPEFFPDATTRVQGEAEPIMDRIISDLLSGSLQPLYDSRNLPPFDIKNNYVWPDRKIFPDWKWPASVMRKHSQEWQRGCSNYCTFCSAVRLQGSVRTRDIGDIKKEIKESMHLKPGDSIFSLDLNTSAIPPEEMRELFKYLKENGIRWYTEGTVAPLIKDYEMNGEEKSILALMSAKDDLGGCYSFLYGVDDMVAEKVAGSRDKDIQLLGDAVSIFRKMGIPLNLSVVVGLDHHTYPQTFFQIAGLLEEVRAPYSFIHIATPYPGTVWGNSALSKGIIYDNESTHYNHRRVVMTPKSMRADELQQGYFWLLRHLNSPASIAKTAKMNIDPEQLIKNPTLTMIQSGLPWGIETYLTSLELSARKYMDKSVQQELDLGYKNWQSRGKASLLA